MSIGLRSKGPNGAGGITDDGRKEEGGREEKIWRKPITTL